MTTLDASLVIAHLVGSDAHHAAATDYLVASADQEHAISTVTLAEILVGPTRDGRSRAVLAVLDSIGVSETPLPPDAARRLAELRVETGLKLPDCCVVLLAEQLGSGLASFDERLRQVASARGIPVLPGLSA